MTEPEIGHGSPDAEIDLSAGDVAEQDEDDDNPYPDVYEEPDTSSPE
jgi:hypothetical protein